MNSLTHICQLSNIFSEKATEYTENQSWVSHVSGVKALKSPKLPRVYVKAEPELITTGFIFCTHSFTAATWMNDTVKLLYAKAIIKMEKEMEFWKNQKFKCKGK